MCNYLEIFAIGVSLSMDALAVSMALGTAEKELFTWSKMIVTSLFFGIFQAVMPTIGWFGGSFLGSTVQTYGRLVACVLLALIGGKMIYDSIKENCGKEKNKKEESGKKWGYWMVTGLAFATSIDALLVGVGFACLGKKNILTDVIIIGMTTFFISLGGCIAGRKCGNIFGNKCEIAGGVVLIGIGLKILLIG